MWTLTNSVVAEYSISSWSALFAKWKIISNGRNVMYLEIYYIWPLELYNGLSKLYSIEVDGSVQSVSIRVAMTSYTPKELLHNPSR